MSCRTAINQADRIFVFGWEFNKFTKETKYFGREEKGKFMLTEIQERWDSSRRIYWFLK